MKDGNDQQQPPAESGPREPPEPIVIRKWDKLPGIAPRFENRRGE